MIFIINFEQLNLNERLTMLSLQQIIGLFYNGELSHLLADKFQGQIIPAGSGDIEVCITFRERTVSPTIQEIAPAIVEHFTKRGCVAKWDGDTLNAGFYFRDQAESTKFVYAVITPMDEHCPPRTFLRLSTNLLFA